MVAIHIVLLSNAFEKVENICQMYVLQIVVNGAPGVFAVKGSLGSTIQIHISLELSCNWLALHTLIERGRGRG